MRFKEAGGKTLVEQTPINVGRNPAGLVRVAQATGANIIMGTAYYIDQSYTPEMRLKSEADIADEFEDPVPADTPSEIFIQRYLEDLSLYKDFPSSLIELVYKGLHLYHP